MGKESGIRFYVTSEVLLAGVLVASSHGAPEPPSRELRNIYPKP